jgi:DNA-binding winged helix-turn-helix (wHTH) protein
MNKKKIYTYCGLAILLVSLWLLSNKSTENETFSETVKIALRDAGNGLLLADKDSTSLILPVVELKPYSYKLAFNNQLLLEPKTLVKTIDKSFKKVGLPTNYRVEVINCKDEEVAYSYQMNAEKEKTVIPCMGRVLPNSCYEVKVRFITKDSFLATYKNVWLFLLGVIVFIALIDFFKMKSKSEIVSKIDVEVKNETKIEHVTYSLGQFKFYPEQNKLVKDAIEINLSKKECELLVIFVAQPNSIIKRDELTKRVWEDQGVFVGRSLDTYISKLRKILKDDESIKLTNIHGVGYKLEVE